MTAELEQFLRVKNTENTIFKRRSTAIKDKDGSTLLEVDYYAGDGYYTISWPNESFDPDTFLQSAQRLTEAIASVSSSRPYQSKAPPGLLLFRAGIQVAESGGKFQGLDSAGIAELDFNEGRLNTHYGDFWFLLSKGETNMGIMSHVDVPGLITAFVMDNSEGKVPGHMVEDIVRNVCRQAGEGKISQSLQGQVA